MKLTLCLFLACFGLYAQSEPADVPPPASREEVQAVKEAVKDLQRSLREADKKAAERSAAEIDSASAIGKDLKESIQKSTEEAVKTREEIASQIKAQREESERSLRKKFWIGGVILSIFSLAILFLFRKSRVVEKEILVRETGKSEPGLRASAKEVPMLVNPTLDAVKRYALEHAVNEVHFVLPLEKEGVSFNAIAVLNEKGYWEVRYRGEEDKAVRWDHRRQKAAEICKRRCSYS